MPEIHLFFRLFIFLNLSICCHSYTADTLPDIGNVDFGEECVRVHNKFRSEVNPPATNMKRMSWDHILAKAAKRWSKKCEFLHNPDLQKAGKLHPNFTAVGENIWTGSVGIFNATSAITDWYDEVKHYNFDTRDCSQVCGHYTQVVWATSYKVGCAVTFCRQVAGMSNVGHFVCNYGPGGNFPTRPYKNGTTCSECGEEPCIEKLCGKIQENIYSESSDMLRPSFAVGALAAVFFVKQHYPTIFFYE